MYVTKNKISYQDAAFPMYFFHLLSLTNLKLHGRKGGGGSAVALGRFTKSKTGAKYSGLLM